MDKEIIVVDSQKLNTIQSCACKYDFNFNENLSPIHKAEPLERGSLIHHMLETYYSMHKYRQRWPIHFNQRKIRQICERVADYFAVKMELSIEDVDDTFRVFKEYIEYYWAEPHQTLAVENVGSKVMYEDEELVIIYETKIDWIWSLPQIPLMPTDHKSSGRRGDVEDLSNQFIGYCWMLNVRNLMVNKIGFQTTVKPKDKFERHIKSYPLPIIEAWVENSVWWIKQLRHHEAANVWPLNLTSCDKYSGCIYKPICLSPAESKEFKKRQLYQVTEPWDIGVKL